MKPTLPRAELLTADYFRLLKHAPKDQMSASSTHLDAIEKARARFFARQAAMPKIAYAQGLPVSERADEIVGLIEKNQVVVVTGETGSGKTTQLPKICIAAGRGRYGLIGHTQPRRIAARSVAERIAHEMGEKIGQSVGYKVRFTDHTAPNAFIKLMTDGILLAETQTDKFLNAYDTIIIDEAHERSLNIDFLLGYLKQLLPKRPDLKVVITSATIDAQRFAEHFGEAKLARSSDENNSFCAAGIDPVSASAPLIEVSGRTYPVEIRYRPVNDIHSDDEQEIEDAIADAVDECIVHGPGDILVFLPGEREIRETADIVRRHLARRRSSGPIEILPLFARLSAEEQQKIFHPSGNTRRIVLATNVAETSLTVPGIVYVIDSGLARMSRYATRSKVQLLHIEKISQASANQRAGRCGRVGPGVCIRLFSEDDFQARPAFTEPEILRSSLASVILRLAALNFGKIERFPFLEAPTGRAMADGYNELQDLGAMDENDALTRIGAELARLPIEPRLARILIEAQARQCIAEALVIVAALSVPDPRERPMEAREAADRAHARFDDDRSDFVALLNLWKFFQALTGQGDDTEEKLSHRKQVQTCREAFVNWLRLREWRDIHRQLADTLKEMNWKADVSLAKETPYEPLHRSLLSGLTTNVGMKDTEGDGYGGPRGLQFYIFPGTGVNRKGLKWALSAELAETTRLFARTVARVEPEWIEDAAADRVSRHLFEPKWDTASATVVAFERVSLHGLTLVARRRVSATKLDPVLARDIFINEGLIAGGYVGNAPCLQRNRALIKQLESMEHRARRLDVVVDEDIQASFYRARIPLGVATGAAFETWLAAHPNPKQLEWSENDVTREGASMPTEAQFPKQLKVGDVLLPMSYRFEPGHMMDGVTLRVPLALLNSVTPAIASWLVPGLLREKVAALFKGLPKAERGRLQPIPDAVTHFLDCVAPHEAPLPSACAQFLRDYFKLDVSMSSLDERALPAHLQLNVRVMDAEGSEIGMGRDVEALQNALGQAAQAAFTGNDDSLTQSGLKSWSIGTLPQTLTLKHGKQSMQGFPALVDEGSSVGVKVFDTQHNADRSHRAGILRLMSIELAAQLRTYEKGPSQFVQTALAFKSIMTADQLLRDFQQALLDRACLGEDEMPRDERAYKSAVARAKTRLPAVAQGLTQTLAAIASELLALNSALSAPGAAKTLVPGLKAWRDDLVYAGFLSATPWSQLGHLPRYVKAVARRMAKFQDYPLRESRHAPIVLQYKQQWREAASKSNAAEVVAFRWLVEELHVSLFAQELKTPFPVSAKRLDKAWSDLPR